MGDPEHYQQLIEATEQPNGSEAWQRGRTRLKWLDLSSMDLSQRDLSGFDLSGANCSTILLRGADLTGADLSAANLTFADLREARLRGADLDGADLSSANLHDAELVDARLAGGKLYGGRLGGANLLGADLSGADLTNADLTGACLRFALLRGCRLDGADLTDADLTGAVVDAEAVARARNAEQVMRQDLRLRRMRVRLTEDAMTIEVEEPEPEAPPIPPGATSSVAAEPEVDPDEVREGVLDMSGLKEADLDTIEGCCRILGIEPGATPQAIVKAFRQKAKIFHPDMVRHLDEQLQALAAEEFQLLHIAYERLSRGRTRPLRGLNWAQGVPRRASPYEYSSEELEKLYAVNPGSINVLYNLAWKYFEEGRNEEALRGFEKVLAMDPDDQDAVWNIVVVRLCVEFALPAPSAMGEDHREAER